MTRTLVIVLSAALLVSACGYSRNIPKAWRPITVEENALKWAVRLCHSFGFENDKDDKERRACIERHYSRYLMENK